MILSYLPYLHPFQYVKNQATSLVPNINWDGGVDLFVCQSSVFPCHHQYLRQSGITESGSRGRNVSPNTLDRDYGIDGRTEYEGGNPALFPDKYNLVSKHSPFTLQRKCRFEIQGKSPQPHSLLLVNLAEWLLFSLHTLYSKSFMFLTKRVPSSVIEAETVIRH